MASSRGAISQRYELLQTLQLTVPWLFSQSSMAVTVFIELQKGQLKVASSFCLCFFGGGLEDLRFPMTTPNLGIYIRSAGCLTWPAARRGRQTALLLRREQTEVPTLTVASTLLGRCHCIVILRAREPTGAGLAQIFGA